MRLVPRIGFALSVLLTIGVARQAVSEQSTSPAKDAEMGAPVAPQVNACQSTYDLFYENEPGVYAYWALCERISAEIGLDYLGAWPLAHGFTQGAGIHGGIAGPVPDQETASQAQDERSKLEQQGIFLNKHAGTLALWLNAGATDYPVGAETMSALNGKSSVGIEVVQKTGSQGICFRAELHTGADRAFHAEACGLRAETWHRVVMTWSETKLAVYVNGSVRATTDYTGALEDAIYYYQLFPGCCETGRQMSIAKALLANRDWSATIVGDDFKAQRSSPPEGGVLVLPNRLGVIHRGVLGYVDSNQDLSPAVLPALVAGLKTAGVTALRYTGGGFADADDWMGGEIDCAATPKVKRPSQTSPTQNTLQHYVEAVARPLHLEVDMTVNYGTNPPVCDAGGDPQRNGADLVRFANKDRNYGIKRWEIGNEQYAYGGPNIDLHPNPYFRLTGHGPSTYAEYEPAFYAAMKAVDPSIEIGVPSAGPNPGYDPLVQYQIPLLRRAKFDALILHSYPLTDPITDGATLYQERVAAGTQVRGTLLSMQTQLLNTGKSPEKIWVTEWNAELEGNRWSKQTLGAVMPLFSAIQIAEFMQAGVEFASWQAQGQTDVCSSYNYDPNGETAYSWWDGCGDTSLVYTGAVAGVGEKNVGLRPGDITPAARGFQILSQSGFVMEGEHMLRTQTDPSGTPWLAAYAATHGQTYAVLLVNRDQDHEHSVPIRLAEKKSGAGISMWSYGEAQYDTSRNGDWQTGPVRREMGAWNGSVEVVLPPLSVNVLLFK